MELPTAHWRKRGMCGKLLGAQGSDEETNTWIHLVDTKIFVLSTQHPPCLVAPRLYQGAEFTRKVLVATRQNPAKTCVGFAAIKHESTYPRPLIVSTCKWFGPFLNQPPPPSEQPQIVEVGPLQIGFRNTHQ